MPRYAPSEDEMDETYSAPEANKPAEAEPIDQSEAGGDTALIANKILSPEGEPLKAGDEIVVRVVKNYGDESEIEYAPKSGAETETESTPSTEDEIRALDTEEGY